jgi:hypothetical protein
MLKATIGRNEVSSKESEDTETSSESRDGTPFTKNDVNFLRSPRISEEEQTALRLMVGPKRAHNLYESRR